MKVWEGHLGGIFILADEDDSMNDDICEQCGDSDRFLGYYTDGNMEELRALLEEEGYSEEYIQKVIDEEVADETEV